MEKFWHARGRDVKPEQGSDRSYARAFVITPAGGGPESQTTIEFCDGRERPATANTAVKVIGPYLRRRERPPRRLLVDRENRVTEHDD